MGPPTALTARQCMSAPVVTVDPDMDVVAAMQVLLTHRISGVPVVDQQGSLVGILTERDCLKTVIIAGYHGECACGTVSDYMTHDVASVDVNESLVDVAERFVNTKFRRYPVLDEQRLVGIISRRDVVRAVLQFAG